MLLKFGIYGRYKSWKKLVAINLPSWRRQVKDNNRKCLQITGEGLLIYCQNSQNIILKKNRCCFQKHLNSTSSLFSGPHNLSLPLLGGRLQLPTRWSPSSILSIHITTDLTNPYLPAKTFSVYFCENLPTEDCPQCPALHTNNSFNLMISSSLPKHTSLFLKPNFRFNLNMIPYVGL